MAAQTRLPDVLVLADDGSTDRSAEIAQAFAAEHGAWVDYLRLPQRPPERDRLATAHELKAFQAAVSEVVGDGFDVVAKMDADLDLSPRAIETVEQGFLLDPTLGMAGLRLSERDQDGTLKRMPSKPEHVEGATKFYRRACWNDIAPIKPILGWDTFDELHARMHGWRTWAFEVPGGDPVHLRRMGRQGSILRSFRRWGACSYGYGAHPSQVAWYAIVLGKQRSPRVVGGIIPRGLGGSLDQARPARRPGDSCGRTARPSRAVVAAARTRVMMSATPVPAEASPLPAGAPPAAAPSASVVVRSLSWVGAGHVVGQAFWFGSLLILAALLPPKAFGTVAIGLLLVTAATRTMESGTRGSIITSKGLTRIEVRNTLAFNLLMGITLAIVIALTARPMVSFFALGSNALLLAAFGLSVALYAPAIVPLALLEKNLKYRPRATVQVAATMTASILAVASAFLGAGVWSLVIRQLLYLAMLAVAGWFAAVRGGVCGPGGGGLEWRLADAAACWSSAFMLFSLTDFVVFNADSLTVGHLTDTRKLGLYALAFTLAFAPVTQFSAQIGGVFFSASSASDPETIRRWTMPASAHLFRRCPRSRSRSCSRPWRSRRSSGRSRLKWFPCSRS